MQLKRGRWIEVMVFDEGHCLECQAFATSIPILYVSDSPLWHSRVVMLLGFTVVASCRFVVIT